jgi:tetratricopeptide (TPR) repeat protein
MKTLVIPALAAALLCSACAAPETAQWRTTSNSPPRITTQPPDVDVFEDGVTDADAVSAVSTEIASSAPRSLLQQTAVPHHDSKFHDHLEEAVMFREEGRTGDAIDALRLALFDAPGSATVWMNLGAAYRDVGRGERAEECAREALRHEPRLVEAHRFLARRLLNLGEPAAARPFAEKLAGLARDDAEAAHLLGRTYVALSMWKEAIVQNRRAVAADPGNVHAYNNLGFAALQVGRTGLALQYLEAAMELEGVRPYMLNNLGIAYERTGRNTDALSIYARAVDQDPTYVKARSNRDRVRILVDEQIADEVSRILAEQSRKRRGVDDAPQAALDERLVSGDDSALD